MNVDCLSIRPHAPTWMRVKTHAHWRPQEEWKRNTPCQKQLIREHSFLNKRANFNVELPGPQWWTIVCALVLCTMPVPNQGLIRNLWKRLPPTSLHVDAVLSVRGLGVDVWGCCLDDDPPAAWRRQEKATNGRAEHCRGSISHQEQGNLSLLHIHRSSRKNSSPCPILLKFCFTSVKDWEQTRTSWIWAKKQNNKKKNPRRSSCGNVTGVAYTLPDEFTSLVH